MKYRVKATIPRMKDRTKTEKWSYWVFGKNENEAKQAAQTRMEEVVGGPGGVIHSIRKNPGRNLMGGIGDLLIYKGV